MDDWKFGDKVRWIDTSIMAVDCLTKAMPTDFLTDILKSNSYDITPDPASTAKKVKKWVQRAKKKCRPLHAVVREKVSGVRG